MSDHGDETMRATLFTETAEYRKSLGTLRLTSEWISNAYQRLNSTDRARLIVLFSEIEEQYKEFREASAQLLGGLDRAIDVEEYSYVQDIIKSVRDQVLDIKVRRNEIVVPISASTPMRSVSDRATVVGGELDLPRPQRLPDLPIPRFDGRPDAWISFLDQFDSVVDARSDLLSTHKMHYLMSALSDEPKRLVQHLKVEAGNYNVARDLLKRRYHNTRVLADTYIAQIMSLPDISSRLTGLRVSFLNPLLTAYRCLERLELPVKHWSYILVHICFAKLPTDLRSRFERRHGDGYRDLPTFDKLIDFLEEECRHHDNVGNTSLVDAPSSQAKPSPVVRPPRHFFVAETDMREPKCPMCSSQSHYLRECKDFLNMNPRDRSTFVKMNGLCYRCLDKHTISSCMRDYRCGTCRRPTHHTLLCFNDSRNPVYPSRVNTTTRSVSFRCSPEPARPTSPHSRTGGGSRTHYYNVNRPSPRSSSPASPRGSPPPSSSRTWRRASDRSPNRCTSPPPRHHASDRSPNRYTSPPPRRHERPQRPPTPTTHNDRRAVSPYSSRVSHHESPQ